MNTSASVLNLQKAMIQIAPELQNVAKSKKGYGYTYAPLDAVIDLLRAVLPKNGVWFSQFPKSQDGKFLLATRIYHISGEWMEDEVELPESVLSGKAGDNQAQKMGASITYFRRYALTSIFGIAADEDTDAADVSAQPPKTVAKPTTKKPVAPSTPAPVAAGQPKQEPKSFVRNDVQRRILNGETKTSIENDYATFLPEGEAKALNELNEIDLRLIARGLFIRQKTQTQRKA